jgi:hypothetical protein
VYNKPNVCSATGALTPGLDHHQQQQLWWYFFNKIPTCFERHCSIIRECSSRNELLRPYYFLWYTELLWHHQCMTYRGEYVHNNWSSLYFGVCLRPGTHYPHVTWAHAMLRVHLGYFNIDLLAQTHTSVTLLTSRDLTWNSGRLTCQHASQISVVAHISWDGTYVSSAHQTLLPAVSRNGGNAYWKLRQRTFLHDTKSPDCRDQHMRANAREEIRKELKINSKTCRELTWREDSVSPALVVRFRKSLNCFWTGLMWLRIGTIGGHLWMR